MPFNKGNSLNTAFIIISRNLQRNSIQVVVSGGFEGLESLTEL